MIDTYSNFTRKLIEESLVPDDVFIQVLIPAKKEWVKKSDEEIISMAVEGMKYLKELTKDFEGEVIYEYTPESFSQTNLVF